MDSLVADQSLRRGSSPQRVKEDQGIDRLERAGLPGGDLARIASVTALIRSGETSMPYSSRRWPTISRVLMPRAYIEITLSSKPETGAEFGNQLGIEAGLAIARDLQIQLAVSVITDLRP